MATKKNITINFDNLAHTLISAKYELMDQLQTEWKTVGSETFVVDAMIDLGTAAQTVEALDRMIDSLGDLPDQFCRIVFNVDHAAR